MSFPNPYDADRLAGSVIRVTGGKVAVNLPRAATVQPKLHLGQTIQSGAVGEFVVIDCGHIAVLGRVETVRLPERDRLSVEDRSSDRLDAHPVGDVSLMASINLVDQVVEVGVIKYPRLGAPVYSAHPDLVRYAARRGETLTKKLSFASLLVDPDASVEVSPDSLFARHCAVVGSTGAGKSFTLSTLMERSIPLGYKLLLIDSTGEFNSFDHPKVFHCAVNRVTAQERLVRIPYARLRVEDMFTLFRPGPQVQSIKLREAVRSLRVAQLENGPGSTLAKENANHDDIHDVFERHKEALERDMCDFDVAVLSEQVDLECVWPNTRFNAGQYGGVDDGARGHCVSLMTRIESITCEPTLGCLFGDATKGQDFVEVLDWFLSSGTHNILRLSLKHLPEAHNAPGVLVNALARLLLRYARDDRFRDQPLVLVVDEVHRYMNKDVGDEDSHKLDGLELIAKEGRKEGLYMLMSTQRPRDLGHGVLSQVGTIIAHRLTHPDDRTTVERAAGEFDAGAVSILSGLAPGQAVVIGVDFPVPVTVQVFMPKFPPKSDSPELSKEREPLPETPYPFDPPAPNPPAPQQPVNAPRGSQPIDANYDPFVD